MGKVRQSNIKVYGENNELNISSQAKVRNCTIEIRGKIIKYLSKMTVTLTIQPFLWITLVAVFTL